jgi:hypothetical protein
MAYGAGQTAGWVGSESTQRGDTCVASAAYQRAIVAAKLANLRQGQKKANTAIAVSQPEAASLLNVSVDSVQRARQVIDAGAPNVVKAVERGEVSVSGRRRR